MHDADQAKRAIQLAHATFERTSFDLIYARAGQTPDAWYRELGEALDLTGGHLSCYQLTLEPGTLFHSRFMRGQLVLPTDEVQAELYLITQDLTRGFGLNAYEVSNYARPGEESAHNLIYWRYGDYAGIGPGAHGRLTLGRRRIATETRKAPEDWLKAVRNQGHGERPRLDISRRDQVIEALLMGLRLEEGIPWRRLERLSERPRAEIFAPDMLAELVARGWIDEPLRVLRVSSAGRLLLNRVIDRLTDELLIS
ncbi:MAG: coproporphyrinogen-III oxidase family protein [Geminicoccaceae bacterium]